MSLSNRSITSIFWNVLASPIVLGVQFVRSIILARIIAVEIFGVYTLAASIIVITSMVANFGLGDAFLHRTKETANENEAAANHFTLKLLFTAAWTLGLVLFAIIFYRGEQRLSLLVLTFAYSILHIAQTPQLILTRRVEHRRLVLIQVLSVIFTTLVSIVIAIYREGIWALLATDITTVIITIVALYGWKPVWKPQLKLSKDSARYYLGFGTRTFMAGVLLRALDRVDDFWTGTILGNTALGYYSRAYTFATYPRRILAAPINDVTRGTYAELKDDRKRLSQAFFRTNAFLIRTGFFLAGVLALIAPEFIHIVLGNKWLPMLNAFRLMLIYTMLDPLKITISYIFIAIGKPEKVVLTRSLQLGIMIIGLITLGNRFGIAGVALAVDIMLIFGIFLLLAQVREHVDYSPIRMFAAPGIALFISMALGRLAIEIPGMLSSYYLSAAVKTISFTIPYLIILYMLERQIFVEYVKPFQRLAVSNFKSLIGQSQNENLIHPDS